jgi:S1-C subfamily serine protease
MFDPYHKWLGIPKEKQPPTYYQLLGLHPGEEDAEVIREAALRQSKHVRGYKLGLHAKLCSELLNEIAEAEAVLLNPAKRAAYDAQLEQRRNRADRQGGHEVTTSRPRGESPRGRGADDQDAPGKPTRERESSGAGLGLILGLLGGGILAVIVVVLVVVLARRESPPNQPAEALAKAPPTPVAQQQRPDVPALPGPPIKKIEPMPPQGTPAQATPPQPTPAQATPPQVAPVQEAKTPEDALFSFLDDRRVVQKATGQQLYQHLLKTSVLVVSGGAQGSGSLVDATTRLVVTNYHVVHDTPGPPQRLGRAIMYQGTIDPDMPFHEVHGKRYRIFVVRMLRGSQYIIEMMRQTNQLDPYLLVVDPLGAVIAEDDDGGVGLNARIVFNAEHTGPHVVLAAALGQSTGRFMLRITPTDPQVDVVPLERGIASPVLVSFAKFPGGRLETNARQQLNDMRAKPEVYRAKVVASAPDKDLALLQFPQLPQGAKPLPLARESAKPGESVHSIGNPGASESLWVYTSGTVRTHPMRKRFQAVGPGLVLNIDATVIETQSPTNPGDSGGPLVNEQGELVGVTQSGNLRANQMNTFIDVSEVRELLRRNNFTWREGAVLATQSRHELLAGDVARLIELLRHASLGVRCRAAIHLGDAKAHAQTVVIPLAAALEDANAEVRRCATLALGEIGGQAVPALEKALRDASAEVRKTAATALGPRCPPCWSASETAIPRSWPKCCKRC